MLYITYYTNKTKYTVLYYFLLIIIRIMILMGTRKSIDGALHRQFMAIKLLFNYYIVLFYYFSLGMYFFYFYLIFFKL